MKVKYKQRGKGGVLATFAAVLPCNFLGDRWSFLEYFKGLFPFVGFLTVVVPFPKPHHAQFLLPVSILAQDRWPEPPRRVIA